MPPRTDDERVMAIAQIDYRHYDIWNIFGIRFRPEKQFFVEKRTKYIFPGTQCQNSADSLTKTTPNAPNFISSICLPKPKNGISLVEKKSSSGFRSPNQLVFRHTIIYEAALPFM